MGEDSRLSRSTRQMIVDPAHEVFVSAISLWEVAIKSTRGLLRVDLAQLVEIVRAENFAELPVRFAHTLPLRGLTTIHRDPFDRLLIAQSIAENLRLVTGDKEILAYRGVAGFDPLPL